MKTLRERIAGHDAVLMNIISISGQEIVGVAERVYSTRFEGPTKYASGKIIFVGSPDHWGAVTLKQGERALVFLRCVGNSERYHQYDWRGHFSVITIQNVAHAVANWDLLNYGPWEPRDLYESAFLPDPSVPWKVAMPYALLEQYLLEELRLAEK